MTGPFEPTVAWLTMRQLFTRWRTVAAVVLAAVPVVIAASYRIAGGAPDAEATRFIVILCREIVIGTLLPLAAAVLGTTAFAGEIDDGTLVYLLVKPVQRWKVVFTKYVVACFATSLLLVPGLVLAGPVAGASGTGLTLAFIAGTAVGVAGYCALFVMLGVVYRRALVLALLYIVAVEFIFSRSIAGIRSFSIREFALAVAARTAEGTPGMMAPTVSTATVWTMSAIVIAGSLLLAVRRYRNYELAERL